MNGIKYPKVYSDRLEIDIRNFSFNSYEDIYRKFIWNIPKYFNIGYAITDRAIALGRGDNVAIYYEDDEGRREVVRFSELKTRSDAFARSLLDNGVRKGDVVGVYLYPGPEVVIALSAIYKIGAIALSISPLIGTEGVEYRLKHSEAKAFVTDGTKKEAISIANRLNTIRAIYVVGSEPSGGKEFSFEDQTKAGSAEIAETESDEPAQLFYTSGSTGPPKGVLHAHRFLLGHIPTYQLYFEMAPRDGDVYWTNADWGWIGALGDVVLPSLYFGMPVVAYRRTSGFSARRALEVMSQYRVTAAFITPTALRIIRREYPEPLKDFDIKLRALSTAGESPGRELVLWASEAFKASVNEFYGCTETNLVVTNNSIWAKPGSLGKPAPGHIVEVVDDNGNPLPPNAEGWIAVKLPDPVAFLGYFKNPEATAAKIKNGWFLIGDMGLKDVEGYLWFKGRGDDVIKVSGYRIGPEEIEEVITKHPAVLEAAVIGKPDPVRGTIVKAFVVLKPGIEPSDILAREIQEFVKTRLAAYAYPREVEFVDQLPRTETGKLKRYELRRRELERGNVQSG